MSRLLGRPTARMLAAAALLIVLTLDFGAPATAAEPSGAAARGRGSGYVGAGWCGTASHVGSRDTAPTVAALDVLDRTDCSMHLLDDSPFVEPIVRDHRDESYGALSNAAVRPLGGGPGYTKVVSRPAAVVRTAEELRAALLAAAGAKSSMIYVDDAAEIDLSYCAQQPTPGDCHEPRSGPTSCSSYTLVVPANTTLASGRERGGSRGARLFSRTFADCPLFDVKGAAVRITGLRIHGPDSSIENDDPIHCGGESSAIGLSSDRPSAGRPRSTTMSCHRGRGRRSESTASRAYRSITTSSSSIAATSTTTRAARTTTV